MTRADPGGGDSVGIDPQLLQSMINTMSSSTGNALSLVNSYIGQMSRVGLDTSSLSKAVQDLTWAQDQVPMLNRRQSIAQAMAQQNPGLSVVTAGAGALDFATTQAAQAAGKADAGKALQALQDHSSTDFILSQLSQYANDPAFLAAYFEALGPQGLTALGLQVTGYQQSGQNGEYQIWAATVGNALATASYQMPYKQSWLGDLQLPNALSASPVPQLGLIQPFLEHGVYSSTWLNPLGQYALQHVYVQGQMPGMEQPVQLDGIWTALAHNPAFDAQFYSQNFTSSNGNPNAGLSALMTNPMLARSLDPAFAGMVQAATIAPASATDPGPYAANAQMTVQWFGKQDASVPLPDPVRAVFGTIAMNYFDFLASSVRAGAPGVGDQNMPGWLVTATPEQWAAFVQQAMHDKTTAAQMLTFYGAWVRQNQKIDWTQDPNVPTHQGFWNHTSLGYLNDFMAASYQAAGAPAGNSNGGILSAVAAAGGAAFLGSLVFGPEGGIAAALLEGSKDAFKKAAETDLTNAFASGPKPSGGNGAASDLISAQSQWDITVREWASPPNASAPPGLNPNGTAVTPVTYMGQTYNGDVHTYEQQYGGTFFNDQTGQLLDLNTIQADPKALAAYNAWLQDPAVVAANGQAFATTSAGQAWAGYARSFTSGGHSSGGGG